MALNRWKDYNTLQMKNSSVKKLTDMVLFYLEEGRVCVQRFRLNGLSSWRKCSRASIKSLRGVEKMVRSHKGEKSERTLER